MKTDRKKSEDAKRKEFWLIIKTKKPRFYRALDLAGDNHYRLLGICASALVYMAMKESIVPIKKKRKPSAWAKFAGQKMKKGMTIKEAAELWKRR